MAKLTMQQESGTPSTPPANNWSFFFKTNGLYSIDSSGNVIGPYPTGAGLISGSYTLLDGRYQASGTTTPLSFANTGTINNGTDTTQPINSYGLAHANIGVRNIGVMVSAPDTQLATGTKVYIPAIPPNMNNMALVYAQSQIATGTSGKVQVNIYNRTKAQFMLTNPMTIELPKSGSQLATGTSTLINTGTNSVSTYDELQPVLTVVSGTAYGLNVTLGFQSL